MTYVLNHVKHICPNNEHLARYTKLRILVMNTRIRSQYYRGWKEAPWGSSPIKHKIQHPTQFTRKSFQ